ncbi:MAG: hypothetical protein JWL59_3500 [Chthoniobacteraceae bacterium]|nr:hypothetical protein [Chthoniobacteraceae bacterium]
MLPEKVAKKLESSYKKTSVPGLRIYITTGGYHAYFKAGGKPIKESLETTVRSIAELRLEDLKAQHRGTRGSGAGKSPSVMTFGDALKTYEFNESSNVKTKVSAKDYRVQIIKAFLVSWPGLYTTDLRKVINRCENPCT